MKQVLQGTSSLAVVRDVPAPPCPPGGVLVRNRYSVISSGTERSRVELAQKSLLGKARERPDLVREVLARARREGISSTRTAVQRRLSEETPVGYSSAGIVIEVGPKVSGLRVGDAVACAGGGHANHAEVVSVPRNLCALVPDGVPLQSAAFSTIAAIALHGIHLAEVSLAERVAVVGCGLVGQIACRLLRCAGAFTVALDIDADRVADARTGGADHGIVIGESTAQQVIELCGGVGADAVLVTAAASTNDPLLLAANVARDRGSVILVGSVPVELPRAPLYDKELKFRVSRSYGPGRYDPEYEERGLDYPISFVRFTEQRNMEAVLALQAQRRLELGDLIAEIVPVDEAPRAYERLLSNSDQAPRGAIVLSYREGTDTEDESARVLPPSEQAGGGGRGTRAGELLLVTPRRPIAAEPRIGLLGPGSFASRVIVPALVRAGARLEVVGGGRGPSAEAGARQSGFARVASDEQELIADPDVDAVVICTRHESHASLVRRALEAGKHVFCEKPLGLSEAEVEAAVEAAQSEVAGILLVGFNRRFSPHLRAARDFVETGKPLVVSYRVSSGPIAREHWVHDLEQGGGRVLGEVCHFIDSVAFLAGSPVSEVHAYSYGEVGMPVQAHDRVVVALRMHSGAVATIVYVADGASTVPKEHVEVFAGSRTAIVDDYRSLRLHDGARSPRTERLRVQDKGHDEELSAFTEGLRRGQSPIALAELRNVSLATLAVSESLRCGHPVRIN
jgi:predicted dehydrogenase/threonine dehydrogenase-like Zn-dependent dehydrogenase